MYIYIYIYSIRKKTLVGKKENGKTVFFLPCFSLGDGAKSKSPFFFWVFLFAFSPQGKSPLETPKKLPFSPVKKSIFNTPTQPSLTPRKSPNQPLPTIVTIFRSRQRYPNHRKHLTNHSPASLFPIARPPFLRPGRRNCRTRKSGLFADWVADWWRIGWRIGWRIVAMVINHVYGSIL